MKYIYIIINPAAGADVPILSILHRKLLNKRINYAILIAHKKGDIARLTRRGLQEKADAIAVYGGDGSIMEAAKILYKSETPLIILPGGTANILAKELGIPTNIEQAIELMLQRRKKIKKIDVGLCNNVPFLLRVSVGVLADMVIHADSTLKKYIGQLAYPVTAVQSLRQVKESPYTITIDDTIFKETGISLVVANSTNVGFSGISLLPNTSVTDGTLYVFLIKNKLSTTDTVHYWQGKKIIISLPKKNQQITRDDDIVKAKRLRFLMAAEKLHVLVP